MIDWPEIPPTPLKNSSNNTPDVKIIPGAEKTGGDFLTGSGFMMPSDNTGILQHTRFQPGISGNPKGRPKGARNRFSETFLKTIANDFAAHGASVLDKLRQENAEAYVRILASLLPRGAVAAFDKSFDIDFESITPEELTKLLNDVRHQQLIEKALESICDS